MTYFLLIINLLSAIFLVLSYLVQVLYKKVSELKEEIQAHQNELEPANDSFAAFQGYKQELELLLNELENEIVMYESPKDV